MVASKPAGPRGLDWLAARCVAKGVIITSHSLFRELLDADYACCCPGYRGLRMHIPRPGTASRCSRLRYAAIARRTEAVEMRFALMKTHHGFERLRLRGLSGARDEFHLAAIVQNLKTMALRLLKPPEPTSA